MKSNRRFKLSKTVWYYGVFSIYPLRGGPAFLTVPLSISLNPLLLGQQENFNDASRVMSKLMQPPPPIFYIRSNNLQDAIFCLKRIVLWETYIDLVKKMFFLCRWSHSSSRSGAWRSIRHSNFCKLTAIVGWFTVKTTVSWVITTVNLC